MSANGLRWDCAVKERSKAVTMTISERILSHLQSCVVDKYAFIGLDIEV